MAPGESLPRPEVGDILVVIRKSLEAAASMRMH
jgi:hypothetical protein